MTKGETKQRWIRPLPERVINKIAAGEVIERPAAVVKELVENAIDADSTRIDIIIEKAGAKLIKIVDNGCGIPEEQIEVAFSRHATSKISGFDDLNSLDTYGFRGEALPSVASVSRLRMVSRPREAQLGTEIIYEGGVLQSKQPIAAPFGTTIEIEDIFFNTPARRKFLKAETTEARHIARTAMAMALSRCEIGFTYSSNGKAIFSVPEKSTLRERVQALLGGGKKMIHVAGEMPQVKLEGFVGTPEMVLQNRNNQFIFINNRFIQSQTISHALMAGYGELLPRGKFPLGVLLLTVDLSEVDVNVHPTKAEVRLSHERDIHDSVYRIIRDCLRSDGIIPDFKGLPQQKQQYYPDGSLTPPKNHNSGYIPGVYQNSLANQEFMKDLYNTPAVNKENSADFLQVNRHTGEVLPPIESDQNDVDQTVSEGFRLVGRFSKLYLLIQSGENLYIVDQHTAHERVLYEENLRRIDERTIDGQSLLFPVQVELDPQQLSLFDEISEMLNNSGFSVSYFGGRTINIEAIPAIFKNKSPEKLMTKIIDDIASLKKSGHDFKKAMAQSMACRAAVMAGDKLSDQEAVYLVKKLLECENKYSCPHGRPTFVKLTKEDIDKQFGRA